MIPQYDVMILKVSGIEKNVSDFYFYACLTIWKGFLKEKDLSLNGYSKYF